MRNRKGRSTVKRTWVDRGMNPTAVTAAAWVPSSFTVMVLWCLNCFKMERKVVRFHQLAHRGREDMVESHLIQRRGRKTTYKTRTTAGQKDP